MVCRSCQAENVTEFGAEINIHFPAQKGPDENRFYARRS